MPDARSFWNPYAPLTPSLRRGLGLGAVITVLVVWSVVSAAGWVGPNKLPAPWAVARALAYLAYDTTSGSSQLLEATLWSAGRVVVATVLVLVVGIPLGILMGGAPPVNALLSIMVMWFGIGELMKVLFLFAGAVVYLVPMVRDAVRAVPQAYWISTRDLGGTPWEAVRHGVLPMALPRIADAVIVAVSVMWTYITVAEYVNAQEGLGQLIQNARRFSAMDQVFAGIMVIVALALATYSGMQWAKRRLFAWETQQ